MWGPYGLVATYDANKARAEIDAWEKARLFAVLRGEKHGIKPNPIPLNQMILKAKTSTYNYEIYEFETHMTREQLTQAFYKDHKYIIGVIRSVGIPILEVRDI
jgi:hypothetical protein